MADELKVGDRVRFVGAVRRGELGTVTATPDMRTAAEVLEGRAPMRSAHVRPDGEGYSHAGCGLGLGGNVERVAS